MIMAGYDHPVDAVVADLLACLDDPALALLQWTNVFSVVQTRLPVELTNELERLAAAHEQDLMCAVGSGSDDGGVDVNAAMNAAIAANAHAAAGGNLAHRLLLRGGRRRRRLLARVPGSRPARGHQGRRRRRGLARGRRGDRGAGRAPREGREGAPERQGGLRARRRDGAL